MSSSVDKSLMDIEQKEHHSQHMPLRVKLLLHTQHVTS